MISICIPTYEMDGQGPAFLARNLDALQAQTYTDYEIIVSDHSRDDDIKTLCARYKKTKYLRNPNHRGNSSANLNNALNHASGAHIKIIFQDDFLSGPGSLACMAAAIGENPWAVHAYWHTDLAATLRENPTSPRLPENPTSLPTQNTIGAPTALLMRRNHLRFDENLIWLMDCEFYYQLYQQFGPPLIIPEPLAVQTLWPGQLTHKIPRATMHREAAYARTKHPTTLPPTL